MGGQKRGAGGGSYSEERLVVGLGKKAPSPSPGEEMEKGTFSQKGVLSEARERPTPPK